LTGSNVDFQKQFQNSLYQQLDTKFTDYRTTPGWKIKILRQEDTDEVEVLFVFNHTNMDGSGAKIFHADLLQCLLEDPQTPEYELLENHILIFPENTIATLSPPPENLMQFPVDTSAMLNFLEEELETPVDKYPRRPTQAHWAPIKATPFKTQFRSISVPNSLLSELLNACRHQQTTFTGLLHALVLITLSPLIEPSMAPAFAFLTAMDLRRFLPSQHPAYSWFKPARAMSNYVTILNHIVDEDFVAQIRSKSSPDASGDSNLGALADLMWSAARRVRRDIETKLEQGTNNDMIGFSQAVGDWQAQLSEMARRPRLTSWVITNLGVIDGSPKVSSSPLGTNQKPDPDSNWSITHSQFIMSANVVSSAIGISIAAVQGEDLVITCTWQDCVIDVALGEAFVTNLERGLKFVARYQNGLPAPRHAT
jgi:hypothetical protein